MLTVCPTPIGNLDDLTLRAIKALENADIVACEDTRTTIKLLNHLQIKKKMVSYHEHNEHAATQAILERLVAGEQVVLVSDAGMPGISDPGEVLIKACIQNGLPYTVLPGPSAAITALVASQIATSPFLFEGFLDRQKRKLRLEALSKYACTLIFYESPHRVVKTLEDMLQVLGDRKVTIAREISKRYETYWHTTISEAISAFDSGSVTPKGEYVLVLEGYTAAKEITTPEEINTLLEKEIQQGCRVKDVAKALAKQFGIDRQTLYKQGLMIQSQLDEE